MSENAFDRAYSYTCKFEGGLGNLVGDAGGETYKGIARNFWGQWGGWNIIDTYKAGSWKDLDKRLASNPQLEQMVQLFYLTNFWYPSGAGDLDRQGLELLACKHFDTSVNMGYHDDKRTKYWIEGAVGVLQKAVNSLLQPLDQCVIDGDYGPKTSAAVLLAVHLSSEDSVMSAYSYQQRTYYKAIVANNPTQSRFLQAWLGRANWKPVAENHKGA